VERQIVLSLTDRDNEWLQAVVEDAGNDPQADGEEIGLATVIVEQLKVNRFDWTPELGLHKVPSDDGQPLYAVSTRVYCTACKGTGGPSAGPFCERCHGVGTVSATVADQEARMSAS